MPEASYLQPYLQAASKHGGGFGSLLWASPKTQRARFDALARHCRIKSAALLDAGCGRADLLDYLIAQNLAPSRYTGIEAVDVLAAAAENKSIPYATIVRGDFIRQPGLLNQTTDVIIFSGSLNTLSNVEFYNTLSTAWRYAQNEVAFNFLCSPILAAAKHLTWHEPADVLQLVASFTNHFQVDDSYLEGDCTIVMRKRIVNNPFP